ncbi:MBOAT family protein [Ruminococcus sp. 5_1_39BFAA]|uniref:MBOAT family O-acyltransferase n=1 Tax=Ruminococcus sp. 5_1_39BFAA TaxID=457412 RepID=UPI003569813A
MVFSSMIFLWIFLPAVLITYFICPQRFRNLLLVLFSLLFYAWGEPKYIILMLISVTINYVSGILLEKYPEGKKLVFITCVAANLLLLGYFKYFNFAADTWNKILTMFHSTSTFTPKEIALPIGISFYTFQALSYVADVYRGEVKAQKNYLHMLLYISFFPQLIAGPIVKYHDVEQQINFRSITLDKFTCGVRRFCCGLGKKVLLANTFAQVVDDVYSRNLDEVSRKVLWFAALLYMLQIYFDFSGYSDMAIGLGKMFGFDFQENFNYPYTAVSVKDFWRRWHISLSSWFRDYLYIPLGGNRKGRAKTYRNLLTVFFLTGMWHGAGWSFVLWGLYHGAFLILERAFLGKRLERMPAFIGRIYSFIVVFWGWILFRAEDLSTFCTYVKNMFVSHASAVVMAGYLDKKMIVCVIAGLFFCGFGQMLAQRVKEHFQAKKPAGSVSIPQIVGCMALFWLSVMALVNDSYNPFIYFRF